MKGISVLNHLLALLTERDQRYQERFEAQERALESARDATDKRLEAMNEFRAQLGDYQNRLITRAEYSTAHSTLVDRIDDLSGRLAKFEGTSNGMRGLWGYLVAGAGVVVAVVAIILK